MILSSRKIHYILLIEKFEGLRLKFFGYLNNIRHPDFRREFRVLVYQVSSEINIVTFLKVRNTIQVGQKVFDFRVFGLNMRFLNQLQIEYQLFELAYGYLKWIVLDNIVSKREKVLVKKQRSFLCDHNIFLRNRREQKSFMLKLRKEKNDKINIFPYLGFFNLLLVFNKFLYKFF